MQVKILKNFKWSHTGKIISYTEGQVVELDNKNADSMIKHEYAEAYKEAPVVQVEETKMFKHDEVVENKMLKPETENKSADKSLFKKIKNKKGDENE